MIKYYLKINMIYKELQKGHCHFPLNVYNIYGIYIYDFCMTFIFSLL